MLTLRVPRESVCLARLVLDRYPDIVACRYKDGTLFAALDRRSISDKDDDQAIEETISRRIQKAISLHSAG